MTLNHRDETIHAILMAKVRVLSLQQIATRFFGSDFSNAKRTLNRLLDKRILVEHKIVARILPPSIEPMYAWEPGLAEPRYEHLSRHLKRRWLHLPTKRVATYMAAIRYSTIVGRRTKERLTHPLQVSHDLGLASVFLHFYENHHEVAQRWIGEDFMARYSSRVKSVPDAVILSEAQTPARAIEFGGLYSAKRLKKFHAYCFARELPYEVW